MEELLSSTKEVTSPALPIIDFSAWSSETSSDRRLEVARDLVEACHRTGFVYLSNHGVSPARPRCKPNGHDDSPVFRGYNWPGHQQVPRSLGVHGGNPELTGKSPDFNETYDMGSDENTDEPNAWIPDEVLPGYRQFATEFYWECWKTSQNVLRALALGLGLGDENYLLKFHPGQHNELCMRHYPSVPGSDFKSHEKERLGAHADLDSFTLLFQDECGGLEVERDGKPGDFVHVDPIEDTLVMNIGNVLMRWSNDYLKSAIHRVQPPPLEDCYTGEQQTTRERYSFPYFVPPPSSTIIECLPHCYDEKNPPKYAPQTFKEFRVEFAKLFYG